MVEGSQGLSLVVLREGSAQTVVPLVPLGAGAVGTGFVSSSGAALLGTLSLAVSAQQPLGLAQCPSLFLPKELRATQEEAGWKFSVPTRCRPRPAQKSLGREQAPLLPVVRQAAGVTLLKGDV